MDLHYTELRARLFAEWPVTEVWGIGSALAARLHPLGIRSASAQRPIWWQCHQRPRAMWGRSFSSAWYAS